MLDDFELVLKNHKKTQSQRLGFYINNIHSYYNPNSAVNFISIAPIERELEMICESLPEE